MLSVSDICTFSSECHNFEGDAGETMKQRRFMMFGGRHMCTYVTGWLNQTE